MLTSIATLGPAVYWLGGAWLLLGTALVIKGIRNADEWRQGGF